MLRHEAIQAVVAARTQDHTGRTDDEETQWIIHQHTPRSRTCHERAHDDLSSRPSLAWLRQHRQSRRLFGES
jgi:hypothetical protein